MPEFTPDQKIAGAWKPIDVFEDVLRTMLVCQNGCIGVVELESMYSQIRLWYQDAHSEGQRHGAAAARKAEAERALKWLARFQYDWIRQGECRECGRLKEDGCRDNCQLNAEIKRLRGIVGE